MIWNYLAVYLILGVISSIGSVTYLRPLNEGARWYKFLFWVFFSITVWPFYAALHIVNALHQWRYRFKCPWCNESVNYRDTEEVQRHVERCQKHPMLNEINRLNKKVRHYKLMLDAFQFTFEPNRGEPRRGQRTGFRPEQPESPPNVPLPPPPSGPRERK